MRFLNQTECNVITNELTLKDNKLYKKRLDIRLNNAFS